MNMSDSLHCSGVQVYRAGMEKPSFAAQASVRILSWVEGLSFEASFQISQPRLLSSWILQRGQRDDRDSAALVSRCDPHAVRPQLEPGDAPGQHRLGW